MPYIKHIITYPIKSTAGIQHNVLQVDRSGLKHDREWALFDSNNQCITGRDHPELMKLSCTIDDNQLIVRLHSQDALKVPLDIDTDDEQTNIFSYTAFGSPQSDGINQWFSDYIRKPWRLLRSNTTGKRKVLSKHGGNPSEDSLRFSDQAPILLLTEASLALLNDRLESPIGMDRFRPNIIIDGTPPHEEDTWSIIQIGQLKLKIIQPCVRCIFTTIDPSTLQKHPSAEPLRTLATYRNNIGGNKGVIFGMHAVPINEGKINKDMQIRILN